MKKAANIILLLFGFGVVILGIVLIRNFIARFVININWYLSFSPDSTFFNDPDFSIYILEHIFFVMLGICVVGLGLFLVMTAYAYTDHMQHVRVKGISNITIGGTGLLMVIAGVGLLITSFIGHINADVIGYGYIWGSEILGVIAYWFIFFAVPILISVLGVVFVYASTVFHRSFKILSAKG